MGAAYTNSHVKSSINADVVMVIGLIAVLFTYLALGVEAFFTALKTHAAVPLYFYIWLVSVVVSVISLGVVSYKTNPIRLMELETDRLMKQRRLERDLLSEQKEKERLAYNLAVVQLQGLFEKAMDGLDEMEHYIVESEEVSLRFKDLYSLPSILPNYSTKLIIHSLGKRDYQVALKLFDSYVDCIVVNSGLAEKSTDVASNAIVLCIQLKESTIFSRVERCILGEGFNINEMSNEVLLFNLACYYALQRDREKLLPAVRQAVQCGKSAEQFINDADFEFYLDDKAFLSALTLMG
ncbi:MAG: hypothetical protein HRU20_28900 [Pseudomonadales bacterium]|nr:hypothetical protein [Pseudomonadales bacterium]